jgi:2-polyprenyl-3-methyl-5-hydroxy-6-metoxy-1,4-benzoquinol methylase
MELDIITQNIKNKIYDNNEIYDIFTKLFLYIENREYKYANYYDLCQVIYNNYININDYNHIFMNLFIKNISKIKNGHYILYNFNETIFKKFMNDKQEYINVLLISTKFGTFPTFLFWYNKLSTLKYSILDINNNLIVNAFYNSDDRIYKYLLKSSIIFSYDLLLHNILKNIFSIHIPNKYILRRLKYLNEKIDLSIYICELILYCTNYDVLLMILKHNYKSSICNQYYDYYKTHHSLIRTMSNMVSLCVKDNYNDTYKSIYEIYNILKNPTDKNIFTIFVSKKLYYLFDLKIIKDESKFNYINVIYSILTYYQPIINPFIFEMFNIKILKTILLQLICYNKFRFVHFAFYKYLIIEDMNEDHINNTITKLNKCYYLLKVFIKRKYNYIKINNKLKELINKQPIIKYININNINKKQLPPYHIFPSQLNFMKDVFIKEKADGVYTQDIPENIEPELPLDYYKAEYIEELDLYLIFDVDNKQNNIEERYNYLRLLHPLTKNINNNFVINNYEDLIISINKERKILNEFLSQPYTSYRWYPKCSWRINYFDKDMIDFINNILNNTDRDIIKWLCFDGSFKCDGFILTPLNNKREIKIKPKSLMSIDLLYKDGYWYDRDNNTYNDIIINNVNENNIYRCYPINDKYEAKEIRYDKTKPNPYNVVNNIICLNKINYNTEWENIYYEKKIFNYDKFWNNIVIKNNNIIEKFINKCDNNNILDLGCGKGKILSLIDNYNNYYGIDYDMNNISYSNYKYNSNKNIFNYLDLSIKWNETNNKLYTFNKKNFDTVYTINSIMHFCNDIFWEQLNNCVNVGTIMVFNIVNHSLDKYNFGDSYIYRNNNMVNYYFEHIHNEPREEKFIDNIDKYLNKYGWEIIETYTPDDDLLKYYTWYYIIKK